MDQYLPRPWGYFLVELVLRMLSTYVGKWVSCVAFFYWSIFFGLDSPVMIPTLDVSFCYDIPKIIDSFPFAILFQEPPIPNGCRPSLVSALTPRVMRYDYTCP
jgi:hypothetical protein